MRRIFSRGRAETSRPTDRAERVTSVRGLSVLLIDNGNTRDFLADTLRHFGATVTAVGSVREAIAVLARNEVQIVVCNCEMSEVDAEVLVQEVRRCEAARQCRIPTLAVAPVERARHSALGVHIALPRALDPQALLSIIRKVAPAA